MSNVTAIVLKAGIGSVSVVCFMIGVIMLIRTLRKKERKKRLILPLVLILVPLVITLSMYLSGARRHAPVTANEITEILTAIRLQESEHGADWYQQERDYYEKEYYEDGAYMGGGHDVTVRVYKTKYPTHRYGKTQQLTDGVSYRLTPVYSNRDSVFLHSGYNGWILISTTEGDYAVDYRITRRIDALLGWLYAPPVFRSPDISAVIVEKNNAF